MKFFSPGNVPSTVSTRSAYVDVRKPDNLSAFTTFKMYLYNPDEKTFCNRTCFSWCVVLLFYIMFLLVVFAVFFAATFGTLRIMRTKSPDTSIIPKSKIDQFVV